MWKWEAEGQPKAVAVIVHNAYEHHKRFPWLIQRLRTSGFHVITGDLPGHGEEAGARVHGESFDQYTAYIKKMVTTGLADHLPLFIIGHGLGATLILRLLQTRKIECAGVILTSPWLALKHQPPKFTAMLTKLSPSMKLNHEIEIDLLTRNQDMYKEARDDRFYQPAVTAVWYKELTNLMKATIHYQGGIQDVPVLVHMGKEDKITDIHQTKNWLVHQPLSEMQYKQWKQLYHDIFQEPEREDVYLYTLSFMDNVLRSLGYIV